MPSPIGHGLASLILGGRPGRRRADVARAVLLVAIGVAPDLDLLWGRHGMETHSVGMALIVAFVLAYALRVRTVLGVRTNLGAFVLVTAVWFAHPLLDALGEDSSPPYGVMMWWPFSQRHVIASFAVFDSIYRAYWKSDFWSHNAVAAAKEIAILAPIAAVVWFWRRRRDRAGTGSPGIPH